MKKTILLLILIFSAGLLCAQEGMYIHKSDGSVIAVMLADIDSVVFYPPGTMVTDIDGNVYNTVVIGTQTWLQENLKTTRFNDGTNIQLVTDNQQWENMTSAAYSWYDNDEETYKNMYGALYNGYAAANDKLCPAGWHVPTADEWETFRDYLIDNGYNFDGSTTGNKIAKAIGTGDFADNGLEGTVGNDDYPQKINASGFTGKPSGGRQNWGVFYGKGGFTVWWSSTKRDDNDDLWSFGISYNGFMFGKGSDPKIHGHPVRCLKD